MAVEALPTTKKVELISKKDFAAVALDKTKQTFVIYITTLLAALIIAIHPFQVSKIALLLANKVLIKVSSEYSNYVDVFSPKTIAELLKLIDINDYTIKLEYGK